MQKPAYYMRISDWSSDVCSSDLALGELQRLQAALKRSELELSYTDIKAPIAGRIGRFAFSVGDFVTPSSEPLATIVSQDPMYVTFPVSARQLLEIRKNAEARGRNPRAVTVKLRLPDGRSAGRRGGKEGVRTWKLRGSAYH